jgi:hypothetical protein
MTDPDRIELAMREIQRTTDNRTKPVGPNPFAAEPVADVARAILEPAAQRPNQQTLPAPGFESVPHETAIVLRWTLRDIRGKRWKMSPIDPSHLEALIGMDLVEMRNDEPALTNSGLDVIV